MTDDGGPLTRRWTEQRWLLDNTIRAVGMDWDQPRSIYLSAPVRPGGERRLRRDSPAHHEARRRLAGLRGAWPAGARAKAQAAERNQDLVTARENYFMASIHWGAAQWPIDENNEQNRFYNQRKKRECYAKYAELAPTITSRRRGSPCRAAQALPAWFHLPPGYRGGRIPGGGVASRHGQLQGDGRRAVRRSLARSRGMAVLALDGPGQYESPVLDIYFSMPAWMATGTAAVDWLDGARRRSIPTASALSRQQLRLVLRDHRRRPRAADPRGRGVRRCATSPASTRSSKRPRRPSRCASCTCPASPTRPTSTSSARP